MLSRTHQLECDDVFLPLKTRQNPHGIYSEQRLCQILTLGFMAIFFDQNVANSFKLRRTVRRYMSSWVT